LLTTGDLSLLQPGDEVYFTVRGIASINGNAGSIQKARFTVNGVTGAEVSTTKPGTNNEFYDLVVIPDFPAGETSLTISVQGEIYHPDFGWF